jgi:hypothetical protein
MAKSPDGVSNMSRASLRRHEDAQSLFAQKRYRAAMYFGGYAVECLLKSKPMFKCFTLAELEVRLR